MTSAELDRELARLRRRIAAKRTAKAAVPARTTARQPEPVDWSKWASNKLPRQAPRQTASVPDGYTTMVASW